MPLPQNNNNAPHDLHSTHAENDAHFKSIF